LLFNFGDQHPDFERLIFTKQLAQDRVMSTTLQNEIVDANQALHYPDLSYRILGSMFEVHNYLGPGFVNRIYANACYHEFKITEIPAVPMTEMSVFYKNRKVGTIKFGHFCIDEKVMVFPVALKDMNDLKVANMMDWMCYNKIKFGIIANFNDLRLTTKFMTV